MVAITEEAGMPLTWLVCALACDKEMRKTARIAEIVFMD
jgi:hypothetical protein